MHSESNTIDDLGKSITNDFNITVQNLIVNENATVKGDLEVQGSFIADNIQIQNLVADTAEINDLTLTNPLIPSSGGTGLSALGTAGQVLAVNATATGLEYVSNTSGSVTAVTATTPITSSGGTTPNISLNTVPTAKGGTGLTSLGTAGQVLAVNSTATGLEYISNTTGSVTSVSATSPLSSSGGLTPIISIPSTTGTGSTVVLNSAPNLNGPVTVTGNVISTDASIGFQAKNTAGGSTGDISINTDSTKKSKVRTSSDVDFAIDNIGQNLSKKMRLMADSIVMTDDTAITEGATGVHIYMPTSINDITYLEDTYCSGMIRIPQLKQSNQNNGIKMYLDGDTAARLELGTETGIAYPATRSTYFKIYDIAGVFSVSLAAGSTSFTMGAGNFTVQTAALGNIKLSCVGAGALSLETAGAGNIDITCIGSGSINLQSGGALSLYSISGVSIGSGSYLTFTASNALFTGRITTEGAATVQGNLSVSGNTSLTGNLSVDGKVQLFSDFEAGTTKLGNTTVANLTATGDATFESKVQLNDKIDGGTASFGNTNLIKLEVTETSNLQGNITLGGDIQSFGGATFSKKVTLQGETVCDGTLQVVGKFSTQSDSNMIGKLKVEGGSETIGDFKVEGKTNLLGDFNLQGKSNFVGAVNVEGKSNFLGDLNLEGKSNLLGAFNVEGKSNILGSFSVQGNSSLVGNLTVTGLTSTQGDVNITGGTQMQGNLNVNGATQITGNTTITGGLEVTGLGLFNGAVNVLGGLNALGIFACEGVATMFSSTYCLNGIGVLGGISMDSVGQHIDITGGKVRIASILDEVRLLAPEGGVNIGSATDGRDFCGQINLIACNNSTVNGIGNILLKTKRNGEYTGPCNITVDTTEGFSGNIYVSAKGVLAIGAMNHGINDNTTQVPQLVTIDTSALSAGYVWKFPPTIGNLNSILLSGGSGAGLSWLTPGSANTVLSSDGTNLSWVAAGTGSVISVSATSPLSSTGGSTPTISIPSLTGTGSTVVLSTSPSLITPDIGVASGTSLTTTRNIISAQNIVSGVIVLNNGNVSLTVNSPETILIRGGSGSIITLPDATTLIIGYSYTINNNSNNPATVNPYQSGTVGTIPANGMATVTCINATSQNGVWDLHISAPGTVTSVGMSVPSFLSVTPSTITTSGTFALTYSGTALPVLNGGTGTTTSTGSGSVVLSTSPSLTTPNINGSTNITGDLSSFTSSIFSVVNNNTTPLFSASILSPNIASGNTNFLAVGKSLSTANCGYINYNHNTTNTSCSTTIGMYNSSTDIKLYYNGDMVLTSATNIQLNGATTTNSITLTSERLANKTISAGSNFGLIFSADRPAPNYLGSFLFCNSDASTAYMVINDGTNAVSINGKAAISNGCNINSSSLSSITALNPALYIYNGAGYQYGMDLGTNSPNGYNTRIFCPNSADIVLAACTISPTSQSNFTNYFTMSGTTGNITIASKLNLTSSSANPTNVLNMIYPSMVAGNGVFAYLGAAQSNGNSCFIQYTHQGDANVNNTFSLGFYGQSPFLSATYGGGLSLSLGGVTTFSGNNGTTTSGIINTSNSATVTAASIVCLQSSLPNGSANYIEIGTATSTNNAAQFGFYPTTTGNNFVVKNYGSSYPSITGNSNGYITFYANNTTTVNYTFSSASTTSCYSTFSIASSLSTGNTLTRGLGTANTSYNFGYESFLNNGTGSTSNIYEIGMYSGPYTQYSGTGIKHGGNVSINGNISVSNTTSATNYIGTFFQPNLAVGNYTSMFIGQSINTNQAFAFNFGKTASDSTNTFGMNFTGNGNPGINFTANGLLNLTATNIQLNGATTTNSITLTSQLLANKTISAGSNFGLIFSADRPAPNYFGSFLFCNSDASTGYMVINDGTNAVSINGKAAISNGCNVNSSSLANISTLNPALYVFNNAGYQYGMDLGFSAGSVGNQYSTRIFCSNSASIVLAGCTNAPTTQSNFTHYFVLDGSNGNTTLTSSSSVYSSGSFNVFNTSSSGACIASFLSANLSSGTGHYINFGQSSQNGLCGVLGYIHNSNANLRKIVLNFYNSGNANSPTISLINNGQIQLTASSMLNTGDTYMSGDLNINTGGGAQQTFQFRGAGSASFLTNASGPQATLNCCSYIFSYPQYVTTLTSGNLMNFFAANGANQIGNINTNGSNCTFNSTSDSRLKTDISPATNMLQLINQLEPVSYKWKNNLDLPQEVGFIADDLQKVIPALTNGTPGEVDEKGDPVYMSVSYGNFSPYLVGAVKELYSLIQTLQNQVVDLQNQLATKP